MNICIHVFFGIHVFTQNMYMNIQSSFVCLRPRGLAAAVRRPLLQCPAADSEMWTSLWEDSSYVYIYLFIYLCIYLSMYRRICMHIHKQQQFFIVDFCLLSLWIAMKKGLHICLYAPMFSCSNRYIYICKCKEINESANNY